jgi:hypothetical protein
MNNRSTIAIFALGVALGIMLGLALGAPPVSAQRGISMQMVQTGTFTAYCFTSASSLSCLR